MMIKQILVFARKSMKLTILIAVSIFLILCAVALFFKPIYSVTINGEAVGYSKDKSKLQKQLQETQEYDEALAHIANQNIEIDLDDGVKVNYAKFQNVEVSREGKKTKKVNLLKKL